MAVDDKHGLGAFAISHDHQQNKLSQEDGGVTRKEETN